MPDDRRHTLSLTPRDIGALERSLRTRHGVLGLTGDMRATEQINTEADLLARVAAIVQEHLRTNCGCFAGPTKEPEPTLLKGAT